MTFGHATKETKQQKKSKNKVAKTKKKQNKLSSPPRKVTVLCACVSPPFFLRSYGSVSPICLCVCVIFFCPPSPPFSLSKYTTHTLLGKHFLRSKIFVVQMQTVFSSNAVSFFFSFKGGPARETYMHLISLSFSLFLKVAWGGHTWFIFHLK